MQSFTTEMLGVYTRLTRYALNVAKEREIDLNQMDSIDEIQLTTDIVEGLFNHIFAKGLMPMHVTHEQARNAVEREVRKRLVTE